YRRGQEQPAAFIPLFIGLTRPRQQLYRRIEARVDAMLSAGLLDEVRDLQQQGYTPELNALRTVGYEEAMQYLAGEMDYEEMIAAIKRHSRQYAKRQLTWFRRDTRIRWFEPDTSAVENLVEQIVRSM
ncbi:tRNA (adenosine(37)-N6)-dimethylallyltransferase MiaA, partial [candidate division KSB1 bacterium]|nr:tRNA (adenosine(37)-N6)-dimethylallyltransferase MiaA [candidate division KSB1 bacterium]